MFHSCDTPLLLCLSFYRQSTYEIFKNTNDNLCHTLYRQHHNLNTHELQQLVDSGFQSLDVNPKDGLLEHDELTKLFDMRDTDGRI